MLLCEKYNILLGYIKMTDLAEQLHIPQSLTSDMMLGLKPTAPKSISYNVQQPSTNKSSFLAGDTIMIDIPVGRRGTWLDTSQTYLKFSVQFQSGAQCDAYNPLSTAGTAPAINQAIFLDNSAYSFIQRLDVYNGSVLLESINGYNQICNYLIDHQLSAADKAGLSPLIGTNSYTYSTSTVATATGYAINQVSNAIITAGDRNGQSVGSATTFGGATPYVYCLPIMSGIIGVNSGKCLPLKDLNFPISLQIVLSQNDDAITYGSKPGGPVTWQISNVELVCTFIEIQDDRLNHVQQGVPQYIASKTYKMSATPAIPAGTSGELNLPVAIKSNSLTQLIARFRHTASAVQGADATCAYRLSSSASPNISTYYWRIGQRFMPQKPVALLNTLNGTMAQGFAELSKSFHAIGSLMCNGSVSYQMYNVSHLAGNSAPNNGANTGKTTTANNAFSISTELEIFSNRTDTILSGVSTQGAQLYLVLNINTATVVASLCEVWAQMDIIIAIQDGQMSVLF